MRFCVRLERLCLPAAIVFATLAPGSALAQASTNAAGGGAPPAGAPAPHRYTLPPPLGGSRASGKILRVQGVDLDLSLRSGAVLEVDLTQAITNHLAAIPYVGEFVQVEGQLSSQGRFQAQSIRRIKGAPASWEPDTH